jgi:hypothetical protein
MTNSQLSDFLNQVKITQTVWALQDKASEGWVVLDSINFEEAEVMPLWSTAELAQQHCIEEWADYVPTAISVADWLEFWVEDLAEDKVMIGVNWLNEDEYVELELADFSQAIAEIESFQKKH